MAKFQVRLNRRDITVAELLADLKRIATADGRASVTRGEYDKSGQFGATTVLRKLGSWNDALIQAGLAVNNRQNIPTDELLENIASVWTAIGRQPFGRELNDRTTGSKFSLGTYEARFGSWNKALIAFSDHLSMGQASSDVEEDVEQAVSAGQAIVRSPRGASWRLRATVLIRDACTCRMCGVSPARNPGTVLHVDHVIPWSKGGATVEENLRTLCDRCNIGRSNVL